MTPPNPSRPGPIQAAPRMPRYVERGGEVVYAQPYAVRGLTMYAFLLRADEKLIDQMVNRELNAPTSGAERFQAASSVVLLNFVDIAALSSADPPDSWLGRVPEKEVAIWVPVLDQRRASLLWSVPFIFVDSSIAMVAGREAYGFPKQLGQIRIPKDSSAPQSLELSAVCLRKHAPTSVARSQWIVRVRRPAGLASTPLTPAWNSAGDFVRGLGAKLAPTVGGGGQTGPGPGQIGHYLLSLARQEARMLGDVEVAMLLGWQLLAERLSMVFLKQFRDAAHPLEACYQGITKVTNTVAAFRSGNFLPDDYTATFADLDGEPICRELGLGTDPLRPELAFWLQFDFIVEVGEVLWDTLGRRA